MVSKGMQRVIKILKQVQEITREPTVEIIRNALEQLGKMAKLPKDVNCEPVDAGGVPAEWITTPNVNHDHVMLYLHGGGFIAGSIATHRDLIYRISRAAKIRMLAIDYRLAPEHPFPAGISDSVAAYQWLITNEKIDPNNLIIGGDSAGGCLTLSTLVTLKEKGVSFPAAAVCLSPATDLAGTGESMTTKVDVDPFLSPEYAKLMTESYLGETDPKDYLASPLYADLKGLPPLFIQVGTSEMLLDDCTRFAERAKKAGVDVTLDVWEDMIHVFAGVGASTPEGREAIEKIGNFIQKNLK